MYFSSSTFLAPYLNKFPAVMQIMHFFFINFGSNLHCVKANLAQISFKNNAGIAPFSGAIWDEFSELL